MSDISEIQPSDDWPKFDDATHLDRILDIIAREGGISRDSIVPGATLDSLGLASLDVVTILMGIEEGLGVYIPMNTELSETRNIAEFVGTIARAIVLPAGAAKVE